MVDWKKEIKFGDLVGRKDESTVGVVAPQDAAPEDEQKTSLWKREVRLRKPKEEGGKPAKRRFAKSAAANTAAPVVSPAASREPAVEVDAPVVSPAASREPAVEVDAPVVSPAASREPAVEVDAPVVTPAASREPAVEVDAPVVTPAASQEPAVEVDAPVVTRAASREPAVEVDAPAADDAPTGEIMRSSSVALPAEDTTPEETTPTPSSLAGGSAEDTVAEEDTPKRAALFGWPLKDTRAKDDQPKPSRFARPANAKDTRAEEDKPKRSSFFSRPAKDTRAEEDQPKPSRFARPAKATRAEEDQPKPSRFARPVKDSPADEGKPKRSSLFARSAKDTRAEEDKPKRSSFFALRGTTDGATKESRPSRFARPAKVTDDAAPRTRGRSPLAREISFRRRPKSAADPGAPPAASRARKRSQVVGLKIGASHVAAAHVSSNGHPELIQYARESIERGVVVGGELRDPEALGTHLKEFFRKHKLPSKAVRLGVGTNRIGVRRFEISGLQDPSHLENAIRFRAQEVLPIPLEEAVLDYQVVDQETDEKGQTTYRVLLVVAYRELIQRYVRACRAAGLKLVGIDLEAFALLRALAPTADTPRDDAAVVVVSIGHDRSTFVVADGGTCEFARVLDWGGGALDVAIARTLDLTPSQAEPIKQSITLNASQERLEGYTQEQAVAVFEAVRKELQTFVRELVSSLHFYQNQPGSLGIGEITITGGTAQLPGLAAELQRLIGVTVRVGDPFQRLQGANGKRFDSDTELGSAAVAIGLGIEG